MSKSNVKLSQPLRLIRCWPDTRTLPLVQPFLAFSSADLIVRQEQAGLAELPVWIMEYLKADVLNSSS